MNNTIRLNSFFMLLFVFAFFFKNIMHLRQGGVGYDFLFLFLALGIMLIFFNSYQRSFVFINLSLLFILLFFSYILLKLEIDISRINTLKSFTVGTNGGIVFAFLLGSLSFLAIQSLLFDCVFDHSALKISTYYVFILIIIYFLFSAKAFFFHLSELRTDVFLIQNAEGLYQRPGDFICMSFVIISLLIFLVFSLNFSHNKTQNKLILLTINILYFICIIFLMFLGQLIGSNKVLLFIVAVAFTTTSFLLYFVFIMQKMRKISNKSTCPMIIFCGAKEIFKFKFRHLMVFSLLASFIIFTLTYSLICITNFDVSSLRIMGYGYGYEGPFSSIISRLNLFKNNFLVHFDYNPLLGNMKVDKLTTGSGSYVHSFLFSILTHLGIIGFMFFLISFASSLIEISKENYPLAKIVPDHFHSFFRAYASVMLLLLLSMATIAAFFSWMPFWLTLGLFSTPIYFTKGC